MELQARSFVWVREASLLAARRWGCTLLCAMLLVATQGVLTVSMYAQDDPTSDEKKSVAEQSLPLRTALHHDPSLAAPLDRLLSLYRGEGRLEELLDLYKAHAKQYPADSNGLTVLIRLQAATGDPEALGAARRAIERFPENAFLQHVLYEILRRRHDPEALKHLDRAIDLEKQPSRKLPWIDELLAAATLSDRRDLAAKHLKSLATHVNTPEDRLELARKMIQFEFHQLALDQLEKESPDASPETMVAIQLEAANAEIGLDRMERAAARLDRLLGKLTADYWQRGEIIRRRLALIRSQSERETIIAAARKQVEKNPQDEAASLDLAQILAALQHRREALQVLLDAGRRLPKSEQIEKRTLEMFDRLRDDHGRAQFLLERMRLQPKRHDLATQHVKTLYELGHRNEGKAALESLLEQVDAGDRPELMLQMARFLRRISLLSDAAELFWQLIEVAPARLEVRRELAETYLAMGQRSRVRKLVTDRFPADAKLENLLDLVQFMIQQDLLVEARLALQHRLEQEGPTLELQLLLLSIERRLASATAGEKLIEDSRELADTAARYRLWLEAAVTFHDELDSVEQFLQQEEARLEEDAQEWTMRRLLRRLAFAEVSADNKRIEDAIALMQHDLGGELPAGFRVKIRQQLIAVLERNPARLAEVHEQLKLLGEEDRRYLDESNARLALLHLRGQRHDLASQLLGAIDLGNIQDPALLVQLEKLYGQFGRHKEVLSILGRLTELNPTDRGNWQRWLMALAATHRESQLRGALRQLLAGVQKMPLGDETRLLLEQHLADSYWRSIARRLANGSQSAMADVLAQLDAVERMAQDDRQWLWVDWIRAYALNRLGRTAARDEAIAELERVVGLIQQPSDGTDPEPLRIGLPDGLSLDLKLARKLLTQPAGAAVAHPQTTAIGPLPELKTAWKFEAKSAISSVLPLADGRVLIIDHGGNAHCVDGGSGKFLWRKDGLVATQPMAHADQHGHSNVLLATGPTKPLTDGQGRLFLATVAGVACHSDRDGRLLWRADVGATGDGLPATTHVSIFHYQGKLLTYEPTSGTITKIDPATGKIVWDMTLATPEPISVGWHNAGASLSGDRLMVYGARSAIVDVRTGEVLWSFEPWRVRRFPVKLTDPEEAKEKTVAKKPPSARPYASGSRPQLYNGPLPTLSYISGSRPKLLSFRAAATAQSNMTTSWAAAWNASPTLTPQQQHLVSQLTGTAQPSCQARPMARRSRASVGVPPGTQVQYVSYIDATSNAAVPLNTSPQFQLGLTTPAVVWAASVQNAAPRRAKLIDRTLMLMDSSGARIMEIDLPLAGRQVAVTGFLVGTVRKTVVFTNQLYIVAVDLETATARQIAARPASEKSVQTAPLQAILDGPLLYATGPWGIHCVNVLTMERVFVAPWPDDCAPAVMPQAQSSPPGQSPANIAVSRWSSGGYPAQQVPQQPPAISPTTGCVVRGKLYTLISPTCVVALEGNQHDGS